MTLARRDAAPGAAENDALRAAIYAGEVLLLPATAASLALCADVDRLLREGLGEPARQAQFRLSPAAFFERVGALRRTIYTGAAYHRALFEVMRSCGFDPAQGAFDPVRLRVAAHRGFEEPRAAPVYYAHRDTWYGHPQSQITWWLALHDVREEETFVFYPDRFAQAVENSSAEFDYDEWTRGGMGLKIGWQDHDAGLSARYPGPLEARWREPPGAPADEARGPAAERLVGFSCAAGQILLFSGAHFHQTRKNLSGQTRFSLDFRTVHLRDHAAGRGAPDVDNRSRGSALRDYVRWGAPSPFAREVAP